ncbi:AMP-binding protein [Photobacterium sp. TY1-4]|uniref:AMP-binding protein n=1 Tax=Photobacterium sp. TY1-4 TaxID=2899122 RepID=UPI0021BEC7B2|nr:AMP-binding protein [Photobacterium sp. TY1-4]UXI03256.1 AMP-binding protein [Photobacterium sp. TY1-4]
MAEVPGPQQPRFPKPTSASGSVRARDVLLLIRTLAEEMRQHPLMDDELTLKTRLDQELGFDSLTRAELIQRSEQQFAVNLPTQAIAEIETPADLLRAIQHAAPQDAGAVQDSSRLTQPFELGHVASLPHRAATLQAMLDWHVDQHPDRPQLYVYQDADQMVEISYQQLRQRARHIARALQAREIAPGDCVAIMLPTCEDYFYSFFGILYARAIPVPIYPPARLSQIEDHLKRHAAILNNARAKLMITVPEAKPLSQLLRLQVPSIQAVVTHTDLHQTAAKGADIGDARADDIAFLQYTSGSTGLPKGVTLTHANLLANIRAMGRVVQASSDDVFVSWLPVYHDMGLIGAWLGSLYHAIPLVIMSPLLFLSRPQRWLWAIHRHRATLSAAPNFAYELCLNKIDDSALAGLDLSHWRLAWNGAEPVSPSTMRRFTERFAPYGFRPQTMSPVYGLAESSVGLTFPSLSRTPRIERIKRDPMARLGRAEPAAPDDPTAIQVVGLGYPLPGHQIRIIDALGRELPDREEGELEFKGPSATQGYYRDPDKTQALYHGDWLTTGDRAFTIGGELFLTGRSKDIIIRAGRNIYPHELEEAVCRLPNIRKGCAAAFASHDPQSGTEKLVILAESRQHAPAQTEPLRQQINTLALDLLGSPADDVVICPPHTIPKTSSGKIRRAACKSLYQTQRLHEPQRAVWQQALRLIRAAMLPQLHRAWRIGIDIAYAGYLWGLLTVLAPIVWTTVALLPNPKSAWAVTRFGARALLRLSGTHLTLDGREHLPGPGTPCVIVANHASYLDGLAFIAACPQPCRFVAKAELRNNPLTRVFLSRLGTEFVERFDVEQGLVDASRIADSATEQQPLVIFPEGTLYRMAGLHEFHMGAFLAAAKAGLPILPVTICGTRSKLRDKSLFPRRGPIHLRFSPLIAPNGADWQAAVQLRDQARGEILRHCGEPDLAHAPKNHPSRPDPGSR